MRKELHNEQAKYMSINYGTAVISAAFLFYINTLSVSTLEDYT
ncbi:hypothetical protein PPOLYM_04590 [Paenibacillus polymyxa]|nr:hypothetical protein [Paenibacillus polymyxa]QNV58978.1 hypothetical protein GE561_04185 [Paenibacillus polymyxa E681]QNV63813.1 hypothetical protein GMA19_04183 [Paenibacillus polymyxa E681]QYK69233.1 hypothetical protein KAI36_04403 [Paenibacillus sp. S02]VUG08166.1 hypothetical protein PPOLYM_04590 [Paenibacillus polymyxa]